MFQGGLPSLKTNIFAPRNGWLEYYFPIGAPIFRGYVSSKEGYLLHPCSSLGEMSICDLLQNALFQRNKRIMPPSKTQQIKKKRPSNFWGENFWTQFLGGSETAGRSGKNIQLPADWDLACDHPRYRPFISAIYIGHLEGEQHNTTRSLGDEKSDHHGFFIFTTYPTWIVGPLPKMAELYG